MYIGALLVVRQRENPERLVLAAHDVRELMEKVPRCMDIRIKPEQSTAEKVSALEKEWQHLKPLCHSEDGGTYAVPPPKVGFVRRIEEFFNWHALNATTRREQVRALLRKLDQTGRPVPGPIETHNARLWGTLRDYFVAIAHHGKETGEEEFLGYLYQLEIFLLDRLAPRTFEDTDAIDALLAEGQIDAE